MNIELELGRFVIWSPLLVVSRLGPRWSTNPLRLLGPLTLYLILPFRVSAPKLKLDVHFDSSVCS